MVNVELKKWSTVVNVKNGLLRNSGQHDMLGRKDFYWTKKSTSIVQKIGSIYLVASQIGKIVSLDDNAWCNRTREI